MRDGLFWELPEWNRDTCCLPSDFGTIRVLSTKQQKNPRNEQKHTTGGGCLPCAVAVPPQCWFTNTPGLCDITPKGTFHLFQDKSFSSCFDCASCRLALPPDRQIGFHFLRKANKQQPAAADCVPSSKNNGAVCYLFEGRLFLH